jgi:hypothetical protein
MIETSGAAYKKIVVESFAVQDVKDKTVDGRLRPETGSRVSQGIFDRRTIGNAEIYEFRYTLDGKAEQGSTLAGVLYETSYLDS